MIVVPEIVTSLPLDLGPSSVGRSKGVHVSEVIRCIALEMDILKYELVEELSLLTPKDMSKLDIISQLRIHMGFAWEAYYIPLLPNVKKHPGEALVDSVYMTPDGTEMAVVVVGGLRRRMCRIHEVKLTYKSTNTVGDFTKQFMWLSQLKSYCKAHNTRFATSHVLFVCGDYKFPISPQLIRYHIEFTKQEIDDNWSLITDYRDLRISIEQPKQLL